MPILHRFWDIAIYEKVEKRRFKPTPHLFGAAVGSDVVGISWRFSHRKIKIPGLWYGVVNVILGLAVFVQLRPVTDRRADRRANTR